jgi:transposase InsO family protein
VSHRRPRLTSFGRELLVQRVLLEGWRPVVAAEAMGVSRATAYKWLQRYRVEGWPGLEDRSSRPLRSPRRLAPLEEERILELRRRRKLGPHRLAAILGIPRSTCYAVLRRRQMHRLDWIDRPTGLVIRRYERAAPGELIHVDVKKLGRIPEGGGHRVRGRSTEERRSKALSGGMGYDYVHAAIDDHSRLAYAEIHADERGDTCAQFLRSATAFFAHHGVRVQRVMTDNARNYVDARVFQAALAEAGARHVRIAPYRPQTNGKVERFNRTLLDERAYVRPYAGNHERQSLLSAWLHSYNYHRSHTALRGLSPIARVNNLSGNYT